MRRAFVVAVAVALVGAASGQAAKAPVCPDIPLPERLAATPIAFVGKLISTSERGGGTFWRFDVDQKVKGPIGTIVDIRGPQLTDARGHPLEKAAEVGVLAELDGATITTDSCGLTDPAALLSVADHDRGAPIKLVLSVLTLAGVLLLCWFRMRRGSRPNFPGYPNDPGARSREARGR